MESKAVLVPAAAANNNNNNNNAKIKVIKTTLIRKYVSNIPGKHEID
jgi:ribosomal protein L10